MKAEHTPGPWGVVISEGDARCEIVAGHDCVARCFAPFPFDTSYAERDANARLIAAAPDLLEALQMLYAETDNYQRLNKLGGHDNQCMRLARAAIAAATGESHE